MVLALPTDFFEGFFDDGFFRQVLETYGVSLVVYDIVNCQITRWIN